MRAPRVHASARNPTKTAKARSEHVGNLSDQKIKDISDRSVKFGFLSHTARYDADLRYKQQFKDNVTPRWLICASGYCIIADDSSGHHRSERCTRERGQSGLLF